MGKGKVVRFSSERDVVDRNRTHCVFGDGPAAALLTYGDSNGGAVNLYSIGATSSFCGCS